MGIIRKIIDWKPFKKKETRILHSLAEEEILKEKGINAGLVKEVKELRKANASKDSQLAKISAEKLEKKENKKKIDTERKIAETLNQEDKEINKDKYGKWFSWNKFFKKYYSDKKFRKKFSLSDMNGEMSWGFGELLSCQKGYWAISDKQGKRRVISYDLKGLFHHPESIFNQFKMGRFLLAVDKNGDYIDGIDDEEDISNLEITIPRFNKETNKFEAQTQELKVNAREYIIKILDEKREDKERIKRLEMTASTLRSDNEDIKRTNEALLCAGKLGKTAQSEAQGLLYGYSMELSDLNKKMSTLQENNVLLEKQVDGLKLVNSKLLSEIENIGDQTSYRKAMAIIKDAREMERANPERVIEREVLVKEKPNNLPQQTRSSQ